MSSARLITASLDDNFSLSRLPAEMLAKSAAMTPGRRQQWRAGRVLLAEALSVFCGCDTLPELLISAQGKPFFADVSLPHFSLSHSKNHLQLLLCPAGEAGGDAEQMRPRVRYLDVAREAFSETEYQWLMEQAQPQTGFWQLWCLREAWLKQQGGSVWQMDRICLDPALKSFTSEPATNCRLWFLADGPLMRALALPAQVSELEEYAFNAASGDFIPQASRPWSSFSSR
jgi:4'-phosphopantetheinyl transferase